MPNPQVQPQGLFLQTLKSKGYVTYVPKSVWEAHVAGLLPTLHPMSVAQKFPFSPCPTFTEERAWQEALNYFDLANKAAGWILSEGKWFYVHIRRISIRQDVHKYPLPATVADVLSLINAEREKIRNEFSLQVSLARTIRAATFYGRIVFLYQAQVYDLKQVENLRARLIDRIKGIGMPDLLKVARQLNEKV